jgi:hypothetical protein
MKNKYRLLFLVALVIFSVSFRVNVVHGLKITPEPLNMANGLETNFYYTTFEPFIWNLESQGYVCTTAFDAGGDLVYYYYDCTKLITVAPVYKAAQNDYRTLTGWGEDNSYNITDSGYFASDSPFIYFQNPPNGNLSVSLSSQLDKYYPKPSFNQTNGWLLNSNDNKISFNDKEEPYLFYELGMNKLTLNRNGRNFYSKEELMQYLQNSDFLSELGFSEIEKKNSLEYFIPKLEESKDQNYYYLTILSDKSVEEISQLNINPKPKNLIRQYFAVYPTPVEVKTEGDFIFSHLQKEDGFTVKETGEFLVQEPMQVFFE